MYCSQCFKKAGTVLALISALMMGATTASAEGARFYEKDFSDKTIKLAQWASGKVSNKLGGVTFLVYGGNDKQVNTARKVAKRLNAEGMPVGFIRAKDLDRDLDTVNISIYTMGGTQYKSGNLDDNELAEFEQGLYKQAKEAYQDEFGKKDVQKPTTNDAPPSEKR